MYQQYLHSSFMPSASAFGDSRESHYAYVSVLIDCVLIKRFSWLMRTARIGALPQEAELAPPIGGVRHAINYNLLPR